MRLPLSDLTRPPDLRLSSLEIGRFPNQQDSQPSLSQTRSLYSNKWYAIFGIRDLPTSSKAAVQGVSWGWRSSARRCLMLIRAACSAYCLPYCTEVLQSAHFRTVHRIWSQRTEEKSYDSGSYAELTPLVWRSNALLHTYTCLYIFLKKWIITLSEFFRCLLCLGTSLTITSIIKTLLYNWPARVKGNGLRCRITYGSNRGDRSEKVNEKNKSSYSYWFLNHEEKCCRDNAFGA